jgi:protein-L-isoaspartate(D-aspartate) O-methyltransferase
MQLLLLAPRKPASSSAGSLGRLFGEPEKGCVSEQDYGVFSIEQFSVEQCRRFYAEEIRIVAGLASPALVEAFARAPRERFLGPPPWKYSSGTSLAPASYRSTSQVRDLYHDVFVALKQQQFLNNGQPSILARLMAALDLAPGKRVVHVGCGTGYYSAIMAEAVGQAGAVTALEIDPGLAACAAENLAGYSNVKILNQDGAFFAPVAADAILINAGVTHPHPAWLNGLSEAGVLVAPLLVGITSASNDAMVLRTIRHGQRFAAEPVTLLTIYPSPSMRDPEIQSRLSASFQSHELIRLRSLRIDAHDRTASCLVHSPAFCLSAESLQDRDR